MNVFDKLTNQQQRALLKANEQATVFCGSYGEAHRGSCLALEKTGYLKHVTINTFEITAEGRLVLEYRS